MVKNLNQYYKILVWNRGALQVLGLFALLEKLRHIWQKKSEDWQKIKKQRSFMMGALPNDKDAYHNEKPRQKVTLTKGVLVSKYACTQGLYESVMG